MCAENITAGKGGGGDEISCTLKGESVAYLYCVSIYSYLLWNSLIVLTVVA